MGLFDIFKKKSLPLQTETLNRYLNQVISQMLGNQINLSQDSTSFVKDGYAGNADLYSIINYLITTAGNIPLKLQVLEGDKWEDNPDSKLIKRIHNPNPLTSYALFIEETLGWKLIDGNNYVYAPRIQGGMNKGQTLELWTMPSTGMQIIGGDIAEPITGFTYNKWEERGIIPACDVMYDRYFNPLGTLSTNKLESLSGLSPLHALSLVAKKSNSGALAEFSTFDQNGAIGIISAKKDEGLSKIQSDNLTNRWKADHGGASQYGKIVTTPGQIDWNRLNMSPADLKIVESTLAAKRQMSAAYKMPTQLLNDADGATFSNQNEAQKSVYTNALLPEMSQIGQNFVRWLGDSYHPKETIRIIPDTSNIEVLQQDMKLQTEWLEKAWWLKGTDKQRIMGQEETEEMNTYFIPNGLTRIEDLELLADRSRLLNELSN